MPIPTKKIDVGSLSQVQNPDGNQIYRADAQDWVWRDGKWHVVRDISNATDLSKVKPTKYADGTEQPTIFVKDGEEYNSSGTQNNIKTQKSVSNPIIMPTKTDNGLIGNFQDRIDNPEKYDAIAIKNSDGSKSTIKMASGEGDGKYFAYPTIFLENGKLVEYTDTKKAFQKAKELGQVKVFNTDTEAKSYAENGYKKGTKLENYTFNGGSLDELTKKASDEYNAKLLAKGKADNKIAKTAEIGNTAMNVAGGVLGLGQMIGGAKILGKTKAPKYPYEQLPNQQLSARLGDVQRLSQIGDPIIREKMMRDMAMQNAKNDAVAKVSSGGDVASYAAQSQVNSSANNDAIRNIGASELAFKTQQGGILDGLIAQKIQEDNARQKGKIDKFGIDYNEFKAKRNYGEQLVNKGIGNLFSAGKGVSEGATILQRTGQNTEQFNRQQAELDNLKSAGVVPTVQDNSTTATPTVNTPQFNLTGILPSAYNAMNGNNPVGIGVLDTINKNKNYLAPYGQPVTQPTKVYNPTWYDKAYNKGDMAYMGTPEGYAQYVSKVAKIPKEKIMYQYKNQINPKTQKPYTYDEVIKSMTDEKIGSKHRMAQTLINELKL